MPSVLDGDVPEALRSDLAFANVIFEADQHSQAQQNETVAEMARLCNQYTFFKTIANLAPYEAAYTAMKQKVAAAKKTSEDMMKLDQLKEEATELLAAETLMGAYDLASRSSASIDRVGGAVSCKAARDFLQELSESFMTAAAVKVESTVNTWLGSVAEQWWSDEGLCISASDACQKMVATFTEKETPIIINVFQCSEKIAFMTSSAGMQGNRVSHIKAEVSRAWALLVPLALKLSGPAGVLSVIADACHFLRVISLHNESETNKPILTAIEQVVNRHAAHISADLKTEFLSNVFLCKHFQDRFQDANKKQQQKNNNNTRRTSPSSRTCTQTTPITPTSRSTSPPPIHMFKTSWPQ